MQYSTLSRTHSVYGVLHWLHRPDRKKHKAIMLIFLPLFFLTFAEASHYLIWLPTLSKSVKIGVVEVGHALGNERQFKTISI